MHSMPIVYNVKIAIRLIFTAATRLSFHQRSPCVYASPPVQGTHACLRVGGGGFELCKQSANENRTKFDYRLITG